VTQDRPTRRQFAAAPQVKASRSADQGQCVEIARVDGWAAISDSKNHELLQLECPPASWSLFLAFVKEQQRD
jgi:hypothetical protein